MNVQKIVVPIDYSDHSYRALQWGASLAEKYGAQILLLHVLPKAVEVLPRHLPTDAWVPYHYYEAMGPGREPIRLEQSIVDLVEEARSRLYDLAAKELQTLAVEVNIAVGKPAEDILRVAQEAAADLIVMGTHGRTGLSHVLLGSVAEKVVRMAPCPVFTVRAGAEFPA